MSRYDLDSNCIAGYVYIKWVVVLAVLELYRSEGLRVPAMRGVGIWCELIGNLRRREKVAWPNLEGGIHSLSQLGRESAGHYCHFLPIQGGDTRIFLVGMDIRPSICLRLALSDGRSSIDL